MVAQIKHVLLGVPWSWYLKTGKQEQRREDPNESDDSWTPVLGFETSQRTAVRPGE